MGVASQVLEKSQILVEKKAASQSPLQKKKLEIAVKK